MFERDRADITKHFDFEKMPCALEAEPIISDCNVRRKLDIPNSHSENIDCAALEGEARRIAPQRMHLCDVPIFPMQADLHAAVSGRERRRTRVDMKLVFTQT
jgi:hypothetical protein